MAAPSPGEWPLSAAATVLLRTPRTSAAEVLRLALRELVVRDVLRVVEVQPRRWSRERVTVQRGSADPRGLPVPLTALASALLPQVGPGNADVAKTIRKALGWRQDLPSRLRRDALQHLADRGLLAARRERLLGLIPVRRRRLTPTGSAWAVSLASVPSTALVLPAVGVLLALDRSVARELRDRFDGTGAHWTSDADLGALDAVLGDVGDALDGAADGGSGGDGGDGGGD